MKIAEFKSLFIIVITSFILTTTTSTPAEIIVDITKIAGKSEEEVSLYLGAPSSCSSSKYGRKCLYEKGETEIVFIGNKADWITIEGIDHVPFSKAVLGVLGLKETNPSFTNAFSMRWDSYQGLLSISLFKGASTSDYVYIKVKTE